MNVLAGINDKSVYKDSIKSFSVAEFSRLSLCFKRNLDLLTLDMLMPDSLAISEFSNFRYSSSESLISTGDRDFLFSQMANEMRINFQEGSFEFLSVLRGIKNVIIDITDHDR